MSGAWCILLLEDTRQRTARCRDSLWRASKIRSTMRDNNYETNTQHCPPCAWLTQPMPSVDCKNCFHNPKCSSTHSWKHEKIQGKSLPQKPKGQPSRHTMNRPFIDHNWTHYINKPNCYDMWVPPTTSPRTTKTLTTISRSVCAWKVVSQRNYICEETVGKGHQVLHRKSEMEEENRENVTVKGILERKTT